MILRLAGLLFFLQVLLVGSVLVMTAFLGLLIAAFDMGGGLLLGIGVSLALTCGALTGMLALAGIRVGWSFFKGKPRRSVFIWCALLIALFSAFIVDNMSDVRASEEGALGALLVASIAIVANLLISLVAYQHRALAS